jgi:hypothetical protein
MSEEDDPVVGLLGDADHVAPAPLFFSILFSILETVPIQYEFQQIIAGEGGLSTGAELAPDSIPGSPRRDCQPVTGAPIPSSHKACRSC